MQDLNNQISVLYQQASPYYDTRRTYDAIYGSQNIKNFISAALIRVNSPQQVINDLFNYPSNFVTDPTTGITSAPQNNSGNTGSTGDSGSTGTAGTNEVAGSTGTNNTSA